MDLQRALDRVNLLLHTGGVCELCGGRGAEQHHIVWRSMVHNDEARSIANSHELCALLCSDCHKAAHTVEGTERLLAVKAKLHGTSVINEKIIALKASSASHINIEEVSDDLTV